MLSLVAMSTDNGRAYELYELRGRDDGRDFDDWLKAESELIGSADRQ